MAETPVTPPSTVPEQPEASAPLNKKQPLLILLFIILSVFVISSVVNAGKKATPLKSPMASKPAAANPQQVTAFEAQQEQVAKKDQEEQQQRATAAALLAQIQAAEVPGAEASSAPPMTSAQRTAIYGPSNPDAPKATSQMSERQAEAKQAELAREKQHQDALNSDTVAVDFARPTTEGGPQVTAPVTAVTPDGAVAKVDTVVKSEPTAKADSEEPGNHKAEAKDAAINKYDFDNYDGKLYRVFEGSVFEGVVTNHIDGGLSGPILLMLTTDYYSHDHQQLLLPQGTRLIGSVQAVNTSQARKMVVSFHRAICPDGFSVDLDKFAGLDPLGTTGLATKVDNRYLQTFAVAAAIGGLGGLAQIGNNNVLDPSAQIRNGISSQSSEEAEQILNHFLNRLPIITLKEGSRARVYIGRDLLIPSYAEHRVEPAM
ncbi:TrbI/VirB10 family protein [Granulicella mallensis]|uniref:Type IV secretion system protein VirB10 n=1 Tax=Granulicella mallensis TaxID=940614 RepID=A0A7W7ZRN0_9BACT|nr:TrbI/VirB10 family protein [Granulicella mallensis]MBB5064896.1 type IV secretion system protein VirB10 [Granulicella mallensis]